MPLNSQGFTIVNLPDSGDYLSRSFEDLPKDPYCDGRFRRFSQYRLDWHNSVWRLNILPPRPHVQSKKNNSYVGGILRWFEPLSISPQAYVDLAANAIPLDFGDEWQIDVHQWRTICAPGRATLSVPEGAHRDGHAYAAIFVVGRQGIRGGETHLFHHAVDEPYYRTTLDSGRGIVLDDIRMLHYTTEIESAGASGYRDILVITINNWRDRHYGPEFEQSASSASAIDFGKGQVNDASALLGV